LVAQRKKEQKRATQRLKTTQTRNSPIMENGAINNIKKRIQYTISNHWEIFNYFILVWSIIVIPAAYLLDREVLFCATILVVFPLVLLYVDVRYVVADRSPSSFLKIEDMNRTISNLHWRFIYPTIVILFLIYFILPSHFPDLAETIAPVFLPTFVIFAFIFIGTTFYQMSMIGNVRQQPRLLKTRASVNFTVTAGLLKNHSFPKHCKIVSRLQRTLLNRKNEEIENRKILIKMFEKGMNDLNAFFIYTYNSEFVNTQKSIDNFHYSLCFERCSEIDRLRRVIDGLGFRLSKKVEFQEIVWSAHQLLEEKPILTHEEAFKDLDFKTGINRWYNHNKEVVQVTLLIIPIIISIIALLWNFGR
jgi:hypothetical protein